jgi:hypothetical protein
VEVRGEARAMFAAILLVIAGVLNVIYGIAAISNGDFFNQHTVYVVFGLGFWGWVTLDRRQLPVLVPGHLRPLPDRPPRPGRLRRADRALSARRWLDHRVDEIDVEENWFGDDLAQMGEVVERVHVGVAGA